MVAVVNSPKIEIRGDVPAEFMNLVRGYFGANDVRVVEEEDEYEDYFDTDFAREMEAEMTPAINMKTYRSLYRMTQKTLAEKLGVMRHHVTEMESEKRGISKEIGLKLAEVFDAPLDRFIAH